MLLSVGACKTILPKLLFSVVPELELEIDKLPSVEVVTTRRARMFVSPLTSRVYCGLSVLIPMRPLVTSRYNKSVSKAMSTPSRNKFFASNGPVMRPTAIEAPQYTVLHG